LTVDATTEFSYETIYNINEYGVEFVPTVREALKSWNMTVQYWLAWHIYRRVPIKSIRTVVVMFVSAYWHGLHGGTSLTSPPNIFFFQIQKLILSIRKSFLDEILQFFFLKFGLKF
jgi:MBOAT, membrane-bound O-acyltransferase family